MVCCAAVCGGRGGSGKPGGPTRFGGSSYFPKRIPWVTHSGVLCEETEPKGHHLKLLGQRTGVFHEPCCLDIKIHNEVANLEICTRHVA